MRTSHCSNILVAVALGATATPAYTQMPSALLADSAASGEVRTLEEFEFERQLADRIEVMLRTVLGDVPVVVMVEAVVSSAGIQADVAGTELDALSSLPGLPVARSREVTAAHRAMTVHRVSVTVYHEPNLPEEQLVQVRSLVPKWAGLDLDRGDTVSMRPLSMAGRENEDSAGRSWWTWILFALLGLGTLAWWWMRRDASGSLSAKGVAEIASGAGGAPGRESPGGAGVMMAASPETTGGSGPAARGQSGFGMAGKSESAVVKVESPNALSGVHGLARRAFAFTEAMTDEQVLSIVKDSSPVEVAVVLASLPTTRGAAILSGLSRTLQGEVLEELGKGLTTSPAELRRLRHVLQHRLDQQILHPDQVVLGGEERFSALMGSLDLVTADRLVGEFEVRNPRLAELAREEVFLFEDLEDAGDAVLRATVVAVDPQTLGLALSSVEEVFRRRVLAACSERLAAILEEEIDVAAFRDPAEVEIAREFVARAAGRISRENSGKAS